MRVCVFCGSSDGNRLEFRATAAAVARSLAQRGIGIVYGGGRVGCMGALADAGLAAGAEVIGVLPQSLERSEVAHLGLSALHVVGSLHERKAKMTLLSDAFLALPGGFGTLDELFEALTWRQLGYHRKPCAILNLDGYYTHVLAFCEAAEASGFLRPADRAGLISGERVEPLIDELVRHARDACARGTG